MTSFTEEYQKQRKRNNRRKSRQNGRHSEYNLSAHNPDPPQPQENPNPRQPEDNPDPPQPEDNPDLPCPEDNPNPPHTEEVLTWSIRKYKRLELFPYQTAEGDRRPTNSELSDALEIAKKFKYFSRGKVVVLDKEHEQQIVAIIEFTPLDELTPEEFDDLGTVSKFLHRCKDFVNQVSSDTRSWGGKMWAVGWRKCMDAFKLAGKYVCEAKIQKAKGPTWKIRLLAKRHLHHQRIL